MLRVAGNGDLMTGINLAKSGSLIRISWALGPLRLKRLIDEDAEALRSTTLETQEAVG